MLSGEERFEDLPEDELKLMLERAKTYDERSKIRALIRNIKKSRGEIRETANAGYKRHHQIEASTFKLDQPAYYNHSVDVPSNRRKVVAPHTPQPKHWIPGMMSNGKVDNYKLKSHDSNPNLTQSHASVERTQSNEIEQGYGQKTQASRTQSYGFEQELKQSQSPDLGYPESPGQSIERPSESSDHTEGSDLPNQELEISNQNPLSSQPVNDSRSQSDSESQPEQPVQPVEPELPIETADTVARNPVSSSRQSQEGSTGSLDRGSDGELDQLTQKLAYSDNLEEQEELRKQIRETRERTGKGRMQKHKSFIKIDVKKGSKAESSPISPLSPQYNPEDIPVIEETFVDDAEVRTPESREAASDDNPLASSSPEQDAAKPDSNPVDELSDEMEGGQYSQYSENSETGHYLDYAQMGNEKPVVGRTGKRPTFKGDGSIDFTTVLVKSQKSPDRARYSPRQGVEQHSFKNVLKRTASPGQTKKSPEPHQQVSFKDVLTNKVVTNQHKMKKPPVVPDKPNASRNGISESPVINPEEYEDSLPQQMSFHSEPLQRSPSPDQLPAPSQEPRPNTNYNNCQEDISVPEIHTDSLEDDVSKRESFPDDDDDDEAAIIFRRDSLEMGKKSRQGLKDFNKQKSLSKLRMSITDDYVPSLPSQESIPEERSQPAPEAQDEEVYNPAAPPSRDSPPPTSSPTKPPSVERISQNTSSESANPSSYELRKMERRRKRELSGRNRSEEDQLQAETDGHVKTRDKRSGGENAGVSVRSARDSYLKTTGISNDKKNSRSPTASPNSHSGRTLAWAQSRTTTYNVVIRDLTNSWRDGLAFCALVHSFVPEKFDFDSLTPDNPKDNLELAFQVASEFGVERLMDPEDILEMTIPDQRCIMTYLSSIYKVFVQN